MRQVLRSTFIIIFLLVQIQSQAQFNVKTLFTPIHYQLPVRLYETVSNEEQGEVSIPLNSVPAIDEADSINGWQKWTLVDNYTFGKNRGSLPMINDLKSLHPFFRDKIIELIADCKEKGIELAIVETYRTHAKQHEYKTMGKRYTNSKAGQSRHQYGLAVDVVPVVDSVAVWDNTLLWKKIGIVGEKLGLRWGGRWRNPYDPGHFEWTGGVTTYHLGKGQFPKLPLFEEEYPCIDEDLRLLQRYWREWEIAQSALTRK